MLKTGVHGVFACLQERLELQRQAEADFAAERALVDEVVARIQQEDRMELAARWAKQADTKVGVSAGASQHRRGTHQLDTFTQAALGL